MFVAIVHLPEFHPNILNIRATVTDVEIAQHPNRFWDIAVKISRKVDEIVLIAEWSGQLQRGEVISNLLSPFAWRPGDIDGFITDGDTKLCRHG